MPSCMCHMEVTRVLLAYMPELPKHGVMPYSQVHVPAKHCTRLLTAALRFSLKQSGWSGGQSMAAAKPG